MPAARRPSRRARPRLDRTYSHGAPASTHLFPEVSAHLLAVTPRADWLEYVDWADPVLREPLRPSQGQVRPSERPGLGLEWNEAAVEKFALR